MRTFKFLSILVFFAVFIIGKINAHAPEFGTKKEQATKQIEKRINSTDQDEDSPLKRKRRPRGIEVDVPHIADISFEQPFTYTPFKTQWTSNIFTSFLYHVDLKRGPPLG